MPAVPEKSGQYVKSRSWALQNTEFFHLFLNLVELSTCLPIKIGFGIVKASVLKVW